VRALSLLLVSLLCGPGCGGLGVGLTVHNDTPSAVTVEGVAKGFAVAPGERVRVESILALGELVARDAAGAEVARVAPTDVPTGGEVVWTLAGTVCYAEADYGSYYGDERVVPAGAELLGSLDPGQTLYVSRGRVDAPPGGKLPARSRRRAVAIVEVPCQARRQGDAILRSWLEVALRDIQPEG
jgi:hypothetical protein